MSVTIHAVELQPTLSGRWFPVCTCGWAPPREYALRRDARIVGATHVRNQTLADMEERRRRRDDAGDE